MTLQIKTTSDIIKARNDESAEGKVITRHELKGILKKVTDPAEKKEVVGIVKKLNEQARAEAKVMPFEKKMTDVVKRGSVHEISKFAATEVTNKEQAQALHDQIRKSAPPSFSSVLEQADRKLWPQLAKNFVPHLPPDSQAVAVRSALRSGGPHKLAPLMTAAKGAGKQHLERLIQTAMDQGASAHEMAQSFQKEGLPNAAKAVRDYVDLGKMPSPSEIFEGNDVALQRRYMHGVSQLDQASKLEKVNEVAQALPKDNARFTISEMTPPEMKAMLNGAWHVQELGASPIEQAVESYQKLLRNPEYDPSYAAAAAAPFVAKMKEYDMSKDLMRFIASDDNKHESAAKNLMVQTARQDAETRGYLEQLAAVRQGLSAYGFDQLPQQERSKILHATSLLNKVRHP